MQQKELSRVRIYTYWWEYPQFSGKGLYYPILFKVMQGRNYLLNNYSMDTMPAGKQFMPSRLTPARFRRTLRFGYSLCCTARILELFIEPSLSFFSS